jgi:hypothetical protein
MEESKVEQLERALSARESPVDKEKRLTDEAQRRADEEKSALCSFNEIRLGGKSVKLVFTREPDLPLSLEGWFCESQLQQCLS